MEQPKLSDNCQTSPVSAGGGDIAHARRAELDDRWRCGDTGGCSREERQAEYDREEGQENKWRGDEARKEQEIGYNRAQERLEERSHRDRWAQQERNCSTDLDLWSESREPVLSWRNTVVREGAGSLQCTVKPPPGSETLSRESAPPSARQGVGVPPADGEWGGIAAAPPVGGDGDEWRKKKHRRRPSKKKRRWKPYFKLSWEEKRQLEERESQRASRLRAEMFAKGQPVAPYNTTQFLMEDHAQAEPDLRSGGGTESSEDEPLEEESEGPGSDGTGGPPGAGLRPGGFLLKDFSETYERYHTESLQNMSKQQLVREYLELEKCLSRMEDENNQLRKQGLNTPHRQTIHEKSHPRKDFHNHAGNSLQHPHYPGAERQQALLARGDPNPGTDPIPREYPLHCPTGDFHTQTGSLPRGYPLQLSRIESQPRLEAPEILNPRIRELELELDMLRAQNTQLLQEKKEGGPGNSCRD